jgi:hypothetical protein
MLSIPSEILKCRRLVSPPYWTAEYTNSHPQLSEAEKLAVSLARVSVWEAGAERIVTSGCSGGALGAQEDNRNPPMPPKTAKLVKIALFFIVLNLLLDRPIESLQEYKRGNPLRLQKKIGKKIA